MKPPLVSTTTSDPCCDTGDNHREDFTDGERSGEKRRDDEYREGHESRYHRDDHRQWPTVAATSTIDQGARSVTGGDREQEGKDPTKGQQHISNWDAHEGDHNPAE